MSDFATLRDDVSEASSATLQPEDTSVPPNAASHSSGSPLATPSSQLDEVPYVPASITNVPQAEAPKKKKRKNKKKKKPANTTADTLPVAEAVDIPSVITPGSESSESSIDENDLDMYDPFSSQMSHIDAIRHAVRDNPDSYYSQTNAMLEAEAALKAAEAEAPKVSSLDVHSDSMQDN